MSVEKHSQSLLQLVSQMETDAVTKLNMLGLILHYIHFDESQYILRRKSLVSIYVYS